jgi:tetratricopeptide (TPR) repeat protein
MGWTRAAVLFALIGGSVVARADAASLAAAKAHYEEGTKRYNLGEYAPALDAFKAAYLAQPDPAFLFNIGQCQRQLGLFEQAEKSYRAFLRETPNLPGATRDQVQKLVGDMEQAAREAQKKKEQPPPGTLAPHEEPEAKVAPTPVPVGAPSTSAPVSSQKPLHKRGWFVGVLVGVAVVAVGLGVGLGVGLTQGTSYPSASTSLGTVKW